jgi:D-alanyl-lipoteichoic acid acyltransferase DltB (MBOAT superfamily)
VDRFQILAVLLAYTIAGSWVMRRLGGVVREAALAAINMSAVFFCLFYSKDHDIARFGGYVFIVLCLFALVHLFADRPGSWPWVAFWAPILVLIVDRYFSPSGTIDSGRLFFGHWHGIPKLIGISYLAFRCSLLVLEVRNRVVKKPNLLEYLNFAFFLPVIPVGPISSYSTFRQGFEPGGYRVPVGRASLRILIGAVKFEFLGNICDRLTYSGWLLDGQYHHWIDLPIAMLFYYLFLYCNFSGFCDMAIGAAGLMGIAVPENFDNPFAARNAREFWNRWHITLSRYMRDVVFSPVSKFLVHAVGPKNASHAVAATIFIIFLLIGIWHGAGWNYAAFGAVHAVGVVVTYYYTLGLKAWLGRDGFKAYNENRWIHAVAVGLTFCFCAASLLFFANTFHEIRTIFSILR